MTLDEAIQHAREVASGDRCECAHVRCSDCSKEHEQLAAWLEELQRRRGDAPTARYVGGKHEHWIGVEVEGESGTGPIYSKVACSGCGFENDHEPAYCECCGARMDAEEAIT